MMDEHGRARGSRVYNQLSKHHSSSDGSSFQLAHYSDPKTNWSYRDAIQLDRLLHPPRRDRALIAARLLSRVRRCARTRKSACVRKCVSFFVAPRLRAASRLFYFYPISSRETSVSEMPVGSTRFAPRLCRRAVSDEDTEAARIFNSGDRARAPLGGPSDTRYI